MKDRNFFWVVLAVLLCGLPGGLLGQMRTITGVVTAADDRSALIGVNVTVEDAPERGTITDIDGSYSLQAQSGETLVFSYIGYEDVRLTLGDQTVVDIEMGSGVELNEVVVTALGISRARKALGYAVDGMSTEDIANTGRNDIVSALQGQISGLQIQSSSGAPGAGSSLLIRGINSLDPNRSNRPLYIIDGVEISDNVDEVPIIPGGANYGVASSSLTQGSVSNRIIDINPDDIEDIRVLKGGAATALYGLRASNGVILITTKSGARGKPKINMHFGTGINQVNRTPNVQLDFIDGHRSTTKKRTRRGLPRLWDNWGPPADSRTAPTQNVYDAFYQTGTNTNVGANINAGNDVFHYRISGNFLNAEGIVPFSNFSKKNFSVNSKYRLSDKFDIGGSFSFTNASGNTPHEGRKSVGNVIAYMANTADASAYKQPYSYANNFSVGIVDHPMFLAENVKNFSNVNRTIAGLNFGLQLTPGIKFKYALGLDSYNDNRNRIVHPETDEGQSGVSGRPFGFTVLNNIGFAAITSNLSASLSHDISEDIRLSATVGQYAYGFNRKRLTTTGSKFLLDNFFNINNALEIAQSNSDVKYRNHAVYGELTGSFKDFVYLTFTGRNDWSSTLPKQNRSFFFPSVSLSLILSDMFDFGSFLSFAKLRTSYAIVGKDADPYQIGRYYGLASNLPIRDDVLQYRVSSFIGDENLRPEFNKTTEFGAELKFLENRLGVDLTYYTAKLEDMILSVPLSNATGASRFLTNAGSMTNRGFELQAYLDLFKSNRNFQWRTTLNYATNEGTVDQINTEADEINIMSLRGVVNKYVEGGKIGDLYASPFHRNENGRLILFDGMPRVNWDTLVLMGNAFPDFVAGLNNAISYKGLGLSFLFEWRKGGDIIDISRNYSIGNGQLQETLERHQRVIFDGVTESGEENNTPVELTGVGFYRNSNIYRFAPEIYLQDASWIRLRNISLSYQLPKNLFGNGLIQAASLTFTANNLFLNTPFRGWDPESNYFGPNSNIFGYLGLRTPQTRSYNFKLNITL